MSTDPSIGNQDWSKNPTGATKEDANKTSKKIAQVPSNKSIGNDNAPDSFEATSGKLPENTTPGEIAREVSGNSDTPNFTKDKELNKQETSPNISPVVNNEVFFADFSEPVSTFEQVSQALQKIKKIHLDLTQENKQLRSEITSLNERLAKLEESARFKFDVLVQDALKQDDGVWNDDHNECQKYKEQASFWHSKTKALYKSVLNAISECTSRINQCGDLMQEINKENSTLYTRLLNRYESLEISKRMLERLRDPIELLNKINFPSEQLLRLYEQDLVDLLGSQNDEAEAKKLLDKKLKETGDTRYKVVREWRDLSEKLQKQWFNFIEKKFLPVLDGINDGKPHAEHLVNDLKSSYQTSICQEQLSNWLKIYVDLENVLIHSLESLDIKQISVEHGQPIDYVRHEPIGTEPNYNLKHECIKEITRNGYEYKLPDQEQPLILRTAQVIVVKNK